MTTKLEKLKAQLKRAEADLASAEKRNSASASNFHRPNVASLKRQIKELSK